MSHESDNLPQVLGHPATKEWCAAVDAHHASTEKIANDLRTELTRLRAVNEGLEADKLRLDWLGKYGNFIEVGHHDIGTTREEIDAARSQPSAKG